MIVKILEFPFYAFLVVMLFPLTFFAHNTNVFEVFNLIRLLAILLVVSGTIYALLYYLTRNRHLAAYIVAWLGFIVFGTDPGNTYLLALVAGGAALPFLIRMLSLVRPATIISNVAIVALFYSPISLIVKSKFLELRTSEHPIVFGPLTPFEAGASDAIAAPPSVVHIVLDGYGGRTPMQEIYGHDNASFSARLTDLGFRVFEDVEAPYNHTLLSMSATMNADFPPLTGPDISSWRSAEVGMLLARSVVEGAAIRVFRELGHDIVYTVSGYSGFRYPEFASLIVSPTPLLELSLLDGYFVLRRLDNWGLRLFENSVRAAPLDRRVRNAFDLDVVDRLNPPFFFYSHILAPHPPFTIDADGNPTSRWGFTLLDDVGGEARNADEVVAASRGGYVEKLRYANDATIAQVTKMMAEIEGPLLIIIHGDHGGESRYEKEHPERTCLMERLTTTVAMWSNVPEIQKKIATTDLVNIVNIYRVVFSALTGQEIPLTSGRYFARWSALNKPISLEGADLSANCE